MRNFTLLLLFISLTMFASCVGSTHSGNSTRSTTVRKTLTKSGPTVNQWKAVQAVQRFPVGSNLGFENLNECMAFVIATDAVANNWTFDSIGWYSERVGNGKWQVRFDFTKDGRNEKAIWSYNEQTGAVAGLNEYGRLVMSACR